MSRASELRKKRRERKSTAKRRAETHASGFETTTLKLPDGLSFWSPKEGTYKIDIVPYKAGKGNPFASPGETHYERTFYMYRKIGAEEKNYIAPSKTFGKPDPIQEYRQKEAKNPKVDPDSLKALVPKERQLFLIWDHKEDEKGVQLWEFSYHQFGKLLDARIQTEDEDWDQFYFADEGGYTLRLTFVEEKPYGIKAVSIDFIERDEPLPKEIVDHGICLDDLLVETPYAKLKSIFYMEPEVEDEKAEVVEEDDDDDFEEEEEKPAPKKKTVKKDAPKKEDKPTKKKKPEPVADDFGLERGDEVKYEGTIYSIMKVSPDGTSLTLLNEETDDVVRAVSPADVKKVKSEEKEEVPFDDDEPAAADEDDEKWDDDWD